MIGLLRFSRAGAFSVTLMAVVLLAARPGSAADLGEFGLQLFDSENYQQPGPPLLLEPNTHVFLTKIQTIGGDWRNRVSSLKLGTKAGVVLQGPDFYYTLTSDAATLGELNDNSYALTVFDKTRQSMPDGASFQKYKSEDVLGSSVTRFEWFVPAGGGEKAYVNSWDAYFLDRQDLGYLYIYGAETYVVIHTKSGDTRRYDQRALPYHLAGDIALDQIATFDVLKPKYRSPGLPSPGIPLGTVGTTPPSILGAADLTGVWHTNLGDFTATQQGSTVNGTLTFATDPSVHWIVQGTITQNKLQFMWRQTLFEFGTGELTIANDWNSMEGTYKSFKETGSHPWKLWH